LRVCIATCEFAGPHRNGGIGTFCLSVATALAEAGHQVTVLYLSWQSDGRPIDEWQTQLAACGIQFIPLPPPAIALDTAAAMATSYEAYLWLREREFDVIRFPDGQGHGYYTALAKHQGLDFQKTVIWIGAHGPTAWTKTLNREFMGSPGDLETDFMERESVALADALTSPSQYMLRWMREQGWRLPANSYVQQNILPPYLRQCWEEGSAPLEPGAIRELIFFGRLEERKGVGLFCDALDRLAPLASGFAVTFLGKPAMVDGRNGAEYIRGRARRWPFRWQTLTDRDHHAALCYLREGGSRAECAARAPFDTSSSTGSRLRSCTIKSNPPIATLIASGLPCSPSPMKPTLIINSILQFFNPRPALSRAARIARGRGTPTDLRAAPRPAPQARADRETRIVRSGCRESSIAGHCRGCRARLRPRRIRWPAEASNDPRRCWQPRLNQEHQVRHRFVVVE
jgi:hypothetical protein